MLEETLEFGARTRAQRGNATMLDYYPSTIIVSVFYKVANARKSTDALLIVSTILMSVVLQQFSTQLTTE